MRPRGASPARAQNEVVLDIWEQPWEDELAEMIEGVFIDAHADVNARGWAVAAHRALVRTLADGDASRVPLLLYKRVPRWAEPFRALS